MVFWGYIVQHVSSLYFISQINGCVLYFPVTTAAPMHTESTVIGGNYKVESLVESLSLSAVKAP